MPEGSAPGVAKALVDAAREAELITDNRFDAAAIESLAALMPTPEPQQANGGARRSPSERAPRTSRVAGKSEEKQLSTVGKPAEVQTPPFVPGVPGVPRVPGVQVVVRIDATTLDPQEIAELVRELRKTSE